MFMSLKQKVTWRFMLSECNFLFMFDMLIICCWVTGGFQQQMQETDNIPSAFLDEHSLFHNSLLQRCFLLPLRFFPKLTLLYYLVHPRLDHRRTLSWTVNRKDLKLMGGTHCPIRKLLAEVLIQVRSRVFLISSHKILLHLASSSP